jgi:hypothetical protein
VTQLRGLHPGVIADLEAADLTEVFSAYRDSHRNRLLEPDADR